MNRLRKVFLLAVLALIPGLLLIIIPITISSIRPGVTIKQEHFDSLKALEDIAVQNGDYPIGALVIYKDSIIGTGYNSFRNLNEPTGHAEINAIEDALQSMDYSEFKTLNRDSLILITSFEPCMMCKGTINYHDIRQIYYLNPKKIGYRLRYLFKDVSFYLKTSRIKSPKDQ
jgi:tRNA(Arg) A34 adenosine deaminase TadA